MADSLNKRIRALRVFGFRGPDKHVVRVKGKRVCGEARIEGVTVLEFDCLRTLIELSLLLLKAALAEYQRLLGQKGR